MSGYVPDPEFDNALAKIDLENYLDREGVGYRFSQGTRGLQLLLDECPFCGEGGGKTYVNAQTGLGNCFHGSCSKQRFNKFSLIRQVCQLGGDAFSEHVKSVAQEMGWMPKKVRPEVVMATLKLPTNSAELPNEGRTLKYLDARNVTEESCRWFHLSYCHKGWWSYAVTDEGEKWVSYSQRVIIPICDLDGTMVSFQGRDITGAQEPKYLFPLGFAVAGRHLYNGNSFEDGVHTHAIVGEGAFDAIAIHQAVRSEPGCKDMIALATFGMHLSGGENSQLDRFTALRERGLKTVTIMWDGERKAVAQAVKSGLALASLGLQVRIATLPSGYDPAQGPDKLPTPPALVLDAIFKAQVLTRLSAIRILGHSKTMSV
jgi:DNA primase